MRQFCGVWSDLRDPRSLVNNADRPYRVLSSCCPEADRSHWTFPEDASNAAVCMEWQLRGFYTDSTFWLITSIEWENTPWVSLVSFPLFWGAGRVDGVNVWSWKGSNSHWVPLTWNKGLLGAAPQFLYTHCLKLDVFKGDFAFNLLLGTFNRSVTLAIQAFLNLSDEMNGEAGVPISRIQRRVVD